MKNVNSKVIVLLIGLHSIFEITIVNLLFISLSNQLYCFLISLFVFVWTVAKFLLLKKTPIVMNTSQNVIFVTSALIVSIIAALFWIYPLGYSLNYSVIDCLDDVFKSRNTFKYFVINNCIIIIYIIVLMVKVLRRR